MILGRQFNQGGQPTEALTKQKKARISPHIPDAGSSKRRGERKSKAILALKLRRSSPGGPPKIESRGRKKGIRFESSGKGYRFDVGKTASAHRDAIKNQT